MSAVLNPVPASIRPGPDVGPDAGAGLLAPRRSRAPLVAAAIGALAIALGIWGVRHLVSGVRPPARQVTRIAVLPDTPPPPPPPRVEKKDEPRPDAKPRPQPDQAPRPVAPPAPAPLKMEGAAGNEPSAFSAGAVTQDYVGGPTQGDGAGAGAIDRAQERLYANGVRQLLHDELERQLAADMGEMSAGLALWIAADGRITRWEWSDARGREPQLQEAMRRVADALRMPAPVSGAPVSLRFRMTLRSAG